MTTPRAPREPLVSILTPSFKQAAWLPDNLRSVACQTHPRIEHIVMDGGSADGTVELLRQAESGPRPPVWHSEPDRGQAHALNKAFAASSGEYIGWLNSDDAYFDCDVVRDVVRFFERHPDVDVVYGHGLQTTADGAAIQVLWVPRFDPELLRMLDFVIQPAAFVRRSALAEPMLDESFHFGMDYELWLRLMSQGRRFARIDRFVAIDRHHGERKSSTIKDVHLENLGMLDARYDMLLGPEHERRRSAFYIRQRLAGTLLVPRIRQPLAFSTPARMRAGLVRRQLVQRRSSWPAEYR